MAEATPGPWEAHQWRVCTVAEPVRVICDTANNKAGRNDENAANARLIAAAPALLAACNDARIWIDLLDSQMMANTNGGYKIHRQLIAAIAAASPVEGSK